MDRVHILKIGLVNIQFDFYGCRKINGRLGEAVQAERVGEVQIYCWHMKWITARNVCCAVNMVRRGPVNKQKKTIDGNLKFRPSPLRRQFPVIKYYASPCASRIYKWMRQLLALPFIVRFARRPGRFLTTLMTSNHSIVPPSYLLNRTGIPFIWKSLKHGKTNFNIA